MPEKQTTFDFEPNSALVSVLSTIHTGKRKHSRFMEFVRELGTQMVTAPAGSLLIAGIPSSLESSHVSGSLLEFLTVAKARALCPPDSVASILTMPHAVSVRQQRKCLLDCYSGLPLTALAHKHAPQFELNMNSSFAAPEPLIQLSTLARFRSASYFVLQSAHQLRPAGAAIHDAVNQIRFFGQLAAQSEKTHVLIADVVTVEEWLACSEVSSEAHTIFLRPYRKHDHDFVDFLGILKGLDHLVPRADGFSFLAEADEIYDQISGCPYQLDRWVINAVTKVVADGRSAITWSDLCQRPLLKSQRNLAAAELKSAHDVFKPKLPQPESDLTVPSRRIRPGRRKLGRDGGGRNAA